MKFRFLRKSGEWSYINIREIWDDNYFIPSSEVLTDTLSQFTGLTDRNGKEIYEGDILETPNHSLGTMYRYEATFPEPRLGFPYGFDNVEILGNIYQNKDLLC